MDCDSVFALSTRLLTQPFSIPSVYNIHCSCKNFLYKCKSALPQTIVTIKLATKKLTCRVD